MASENKPVRLIAAEEEDKINRKMAAWANAFPEKPVDFINYERLAEDEASMALSTIQGTYITKRYILGGYQAEYQFKMIYRVKPGNSPDKRLKADELLDRFGDWASSNYPDLGDGIRVIRVETTARSSLFANYENGDEDHQILLKMDYEVNV